MQSLDKVWKIITVILLIYVITAGILVPLKPGIQNVSDTRLFSDSLQTVYITGYNTVFSQKDHRAYIRLKDGRYIEGGNSQAVSDRVLKIELGLPRIGNGEVENAVLIVANDENKFLYPSMTLIGKAQGTRLAPSSLYSWKHNDLQLPDSEWKFEFPYRVMLEETIRNTFFHVAIWMAQFVLLLIAVVNSIFYLKKNETVYDHRAMGFTYVSIVYGIIGVITGSIWARFTWGTFWTDDVKLNMVAISMLIYIGYYILRSSIEDYDRKSRLSAGYNIFAFAAMIPLIMIIPRLTDSLHPGNGGNPAFGSDDMDNTLRMVFYPSILALTLLGFWISQILVRLKRVEENIINRLLDSEG